MDPKIIIIIAVAYLYGFFEVFMNLRQRGKGKITHSGDKGSLWLLYGLITLGYALSFSIGATKTGRIYPWNTFFTIGMALIILGLMLRVYSILTLKQYFTYSVAKVENQKIINRVVIRTGFSRKDGNQGRYLRSKHQAISISCIIKRFYPISVSCRKQTAGIPVVNSK